MLKSWTVLWRPTRPSRTNTQKRCPFYYREQECKSRKSRDTWSNRQIWPQSTKWSRSKATRVLPREHTGHSKHPLPTTQEKTPQMDITRWSVPKSDVWVSSGSWWWTGKPGKLQSMGSQSQTQLSDWTELNSLNQENKKLRPREFCRNKTCWEFPRGPVVKTQCFHCHDLG